MNKLLSVLALLPLSCLAAGAQTPEVLSDFAAQVKEKAVSFNYSFTIKSSVNVRGSGRVELQDESYHVEGNGVDIWCDGRDRWVLDYLSLEAVVESVETGISYADNPAGLIMHLDDSFGVVSSKRADFMGTACTEIALVPRQLPELKLVKIYFANKSLTGVSVTSADGTVSDFEITGLTFTEKGNPARFRFNLKTLDSDWVITDLR